MVILETLTVILGESKIHSEYKKDDEKYIEKWEKEKSIITQKKNIIKDQKRKWKELKRYMHEQMRSPRKM